MPDRPRTVWIGTDTSFTLEELRNRSTGQFITGITSGTLKIFDGSDNSLISTISLTEVLDTPGDYEALIPDTQTGLSEGLPLRLQFDITGGAGLALRLDARAIARVMKDTGL